MPAQARKRLPPHPRHPRSHPPAASAPPHRGSEQAHVCHSAAECARGASVPQVRHTCPPAVGSQGISVRLQWDLRAYQSACSGISGHISPPAVCVRSPWAQPPGLQAQGAAAPHAARGKPPPPQMPTCAVQCSRRRGLPGRCCLCSAGAHPAFFGCLQCVQQSRGMDTHDCMRISGHLYRLMHALGASACMQASYLCMRCMCVRYIRSCQRMRRGCNRYAGPRTHSPVTMALACTHTPAGCKHMLMCANKCMHTQLYVHMLV